MSGGPARQRGRRTLVLSEIALAMIMVTGAGLMVRSLVNARNVDPGFDPDILPPSRLDCTTIVIQRRQTSCVSSET